MGREVVTPRAVELVPRSEYKVVIQGEFGEPPSNVTINHLILPIDQAIWLRDALDRAIKKAD